jgi:hypothetical protein
MTIHTSSKMVTFHLPFSLKGIDRALPAGVYWVVTDEVLLDALSFQVYRHVSTMIAVPADTHCWVELLAVDARELQSAQDRDSAAHEIVRIRSPA